MRRFKFVVSIFLLNFSVLAFADDMITSVSAGGDHSCALGPTGQVKCWGYNSDGQLGDHSAVNKPSPVDVLDSNGVDLLSGVSAMAVRYDNSCALMASGGVKCWGYNYYGQLGDGTISSGVGGLGQPAPWGGKSLPVDVLGTGGVGLLTGVSAISVGYTHSRALMSSGAVKCWGANYAGHLGDGTVNNDLVHLGKSSPVDVLASDGAGLLDGVTAIAAGGSHTCALMATGHVKCWGYGDRLGRDRCYTLDGQTICETHAGGAIPLPVDVNVDDGPELLSDVRAIAAGGSHTCALTLAGGVKCWGVNNGQLGNPNAPYDSAAINVVGLNSGVIAIAAGDDSTCALMLAGTVKCWGNNSDGQLGDNSTVNKAVPVDVVGLAGAVTAITVGHRHSCAVLANGGVQCWGYNYYGQLGDNTVIEKLTPVYVSGLTGRHAKNDYNNDGIAGWIWKGQSNGVETQTQIWQLTLPLQSPNYTAPLRTYPPTFPDQANWEIVTSGDFDKDGDADILWRNNTTADWKIWQMQDGQRVAQTNWSDSFDPSRQWQVIGAGDTDKDGDEDIILNNTTTGAVMIWQIQNHAVVATHTVGTKAGYTLNRIGDFNKDGDVDLLFRQNGGDALITWELQANAFVAEHALNSTGVGYNPVCAADFDNDGDDDIMLVNSTTQQEKWFVMENYTRTQQVGGVNDGFVFLGCGDYDGDGDADSLWQRSSDAKNRVVLQQNWGATKQTIYTNAFGGVNPGTAGYGFVYRGNKN